MHLGKGSLTHPFILLVSKSREREQQARWLTQNNLGYQVLRKDFAALLQMAASMGPLLRKCKCHVLENHT